MLTRTRQLAALAVVAVVIGIALIIYGLPEATDSQRRALQLCALPLSVALAAGNLMLTERAQRRPGPRGRVAVIIGWSLSGVGLLLMLLGFVILPPDAIRFGQFLIFVGLGVVLLIAIRLNATATEWFSLDEVAAVDEEATTDEDDPPSGDQEPNASL